MRTPFLDELSQISKPSKEDVPPLGSSELKVKKKRPHDGVNWDQFEELVTGSEAKDAESRSGYLRRDAARVLMKLLYAARAARFDLLKAIGSLAAMVSCWTLDCDRRLHHLVCYVHGSLRCSASEQG